MDAFRAVIWDLANAFGRKATEPLVTTYWSALHDLTWDQLERACEWALREAQGFPRPVDLRRAVTDRAESASEKRQREERDAITAEIEAWAKDRPRVKKVQERFSRLVQHLSSALSASGKRECPIGPTCETCMFERRHPRAWLHLRGGLSTGAIDWRNAPAIPGCCAPEAA
jgi:hypothetical protein